MLLFCLQKLWSLPRADIAPPVLVETLWHHPPNQDVDAVQAPGMPQKIAGFKIDCRRLPPKTLTYDHYSHLHIDDLGPSYHLNQAVL